MSMARGVVIELSKMTETNEKFSNKGDEKAALCDDLSVFEGFHNQQKTKQNSPSCLFPRFTERNNDIWVVYSYSVVDIFSF